MDERQLLRQVAIQLDRWVEETLEGAWSRHFVSGMEQKAKEIYSFLGKQSSNKSLKQTVLAVPENGKLNINKVSGGLTINM